MLVKGAPDEHSAKPLFLTNYLVISRIEKHWVIHAQDAINLPS